MNQTISVIVVPRERSSPAVDSLKSIIENTPEPHELIYVNGSLTRGVARRVRSLVEARGGIYVDCHRWLRPNEARNIGISHATGRHLVFLDNDVFPQSPWLGRLTTCARETGAGIVSPVYLEGDADAPTVHCAGGEIVRVHQDEGQIPMLVTEQYDLGKPLSELPSLRREKTSLVEFHTVLVTRECLDAIGGGFDEGLETTREHVDLCLLAEKNGFDIYLEPGAIVRYGNETPPTLADIDYFMFRWSAAATERTIAHFERKWQVKLDPERTRIISHRRVRFLRAYRRSIPSRVYLANWKLAQRIPSAKKTITFLLRTQ